MYGRRPLSFIHDLIYEFSLFNIYSHGCWLEIKVRLNKRKLFVFYFSYFDYTTVIVIRDLFYLLRTRRSYLIIIFSLLKT